MNTIDQINEPVENPSKLRDSTRIDWDSATLRLHRTGSDTFRVLVNGNVHPLLVGFNSVWEALHRVFLELPHAEVYVNQSFYWASDDGIDFSYIGVAPELDWGTFPEFMKDGKTLLYIPPKYRSEPEELPEGTRALTFLNLTGDITITWDEKNDEKMRNLIKKMMDQGCVFFTTRHVPVIKKPFQRRLGKRGLASAQDLIIRDDEFDRLVKSLDNADVALLLAGGDAEMVERKGGNRKIDSVARAKDPDEVIKNKQAVATRPLTGG